MTAGPHDPDGAYSVSGTIGQPDAGPLTKGQYSVTSGFCALPTSVHVTGAPTLTIALASPGNVMIFVDASYPGFCAPGVVEPRPP